MAVSARACKGLQSRGTPAPLPELAAPRSCASEGLQAHSSPSSLSDPLLCIRTWEGLRPRSAPSWPPERAT
eukprot:11445287-Alexandrium_andersonii.AAC.1